MGSRTRSLLTPAAAAMMTLGLVLSAPAAAADGGEVDGAGMTATPSGGGYWIVDERGGVFAFGDAAAIDPRDTARLRAPAAAVARTPSGTGLWVAAADGGVFTAGDARFAGSAAGVALNAPVVDIEPTSDGDGYWLLAADGGVFAFGTAGFAGSAAASPSPQRFVDIEATADSRGYWLARDDGAVFPFGSTDTSLGPASVIRGLRAPIVGMATTAEADGAWLVAADGGVFAFGAPFFGSAADLSLNAPITDIVATPDGGGYWLLAADGGVFSYGNAVYRGSAVQPDPPAAFISVKGRETRMQAGGFCWGNDRRGRCTASAGPGPSTPRITVAQGEILTVRFGIDAAPTSIAGFTAPWGTDHQQPFSLAAANPTTFRAAGPPGEYLLTISSTWDVRRPYDAEGGDASYVVRVRVQP